MRMLPLVVLINITMLPGAILAQNPGASRTAQPAPVNQTVQMASPQPDGVVRGILGVLLSAIETDDYQSAVMTLNDAMKNSFTKPLFVRMVARFSPRLKQGYEAIYLGDLKKKRFTVHLWKLSFQDQGDDVLVEVSIIENKVDGFHLRG